MYTAYTHTLDEVCALCTHKIIIIIILEAYPRPL